MTESQRFEVTLTASGVVRDADGNIISEDPPEPRRNTEPLNEGAQSWA